MDLSSPRFVALDTATIAFASANKNDGLVKELIHLLQRGEWIPFVTHHHLEEIACHDNAQVFDQRIDFLSELKWIAYLKLPETNAYIGSGLHLRDLEIQHILKYPEANHDEVVKGVGPQIRSGFNTGTKVVQENLGWWRVFRAHFAEGTKRHKAEVANVTHFQPPNGHLRIPPKGEARKIPTNEEIAAHFLKIHEWLENSIRDRGDCRDLDPKEAASRIVRESYDDSMADLESGDQYFDAALKRMGVLRERLPRNPRVEDVCDEAIFVAQLDVHSRRIGKSKTDVLNSLRKEQLPSWTIWKFLDRRVKTLPNAEVGNVNDKWIASFGPYVDLLNLDKRMTEFFRQAGDKNPLCQMVYSRLPRTSGLNGLVADLKRRAES